MSCVCACMLHALSSMLVYRLSHTPTATHDTDHRVALRHFISVITHETLATATPDHTATTRDTMNATPPPPPHGHARCWCCVCGESRVCRFVRPQCRRPPHPATAQSPHRPAGCSVRVARASWRTRFTPPSHQAPCIETPPTHHTYSPRSPPHRTLRQRPTDRGLFVRTEVWRPLPLPWPGLQPSSTSSRGAPTGPGAATLRLEVRLELPYSRSSSPQTPPREAAATRVLFLL